MKMINSTNHKLNHKFLIKLLVTSVLCIVMALSFASCKGSSLEGRWTAESKIPFEKGELDTEQFTFLENTTCTYSLMFEDGSYTFSMSVPKEQRKTAVSEYKKLYLNYYKLKHKDENEIQALMKEANCKTEEELMDNLLLAAAQKEGYASIEDFICNKLGISTKVLGSGKYEKNGEKVKLYSGNDEKTVLFTGNYADDKVTIDNEKSPIIFLPESLD